MKGQIKLMYGLMKDKLHIYRRVSQKIQETEGDSLTTQLELGKDVGKRLKKQKIVKGIKDWNEGSQSSSKDDFSNRPKLNRLLVDIEDGQVKHLFVYDTDRLSRNEKTWFIIRDTIRRNKVTLYTRNGVLDLNDVTDNFLTQILGVVNQYTNEQRKIRSVIGRENRIKQGFFTGGLPNFGYKNVDKKYQINEEERVWVKKMFNIIDKGGSIKEIKDLFDTNGVQPRHKKGLWNTLSIRRMLENKIYIGEHEWKGIKVTTPQIISQSQFDRVQKILNKHSWKNNNTSKNFYLLTPLLTCGHCGSKFNGRVNKGRGQKFYFCPSKGNSWRGGKKIDCDIKKNVNIDRTNELVWRTVMDTISSSHFMKEKFKKDVLNQKKKTVTSVSQEIKKLDSRIKRLRNEEKRTYEGISKVEVERLTEKILPETYQMIKDNLMDGLQGIQKKISKVEYEISMRNEERGWVDWISKYGLEVEKKKGLSEESKKEYLHEIITKIVVTQTKDKEGHELEILFRLPIVKDSLLYKDKTNKRKGYEVKEGGSEREVFLEHKLGNPNNVFKKKVDSSTHTSNLLDSD